MIIVEFEGGVIRVRLSTSTLSISHQEAPENKQCRIILSCIGDIVVGYQVGTVLCDRISSLLSVTYHVCRALSQHPQACILLVPAVTGRRSCPFKNI